MIDPEEKTQTPNSRYGLDLLEITTRAEVRYKDMLEQGSVNFYEYDGCLSDAIAQLIEDVRTHLSHLKAMDIWNWRIGLGVNVSGQPYIVQFEIYDFSFDDEKYADIEEMMRKDLDYMPDPRCYSHFKVIVWQVDGATLSVVGDIPLFYEIDWGDNAESQTLRPQLR